MRDSKLPFSGGQSELLPSHSETSVDGIYKKISNKARKLSKNGAVGRLSGMRTDDDNFLKGGNEFRDRDQSVSQMSFEHFGNSNI